VVTKAALTGARTENDGAAAGAGPRLRGVVADLPAYKAGKAASGRSEGPVYKLSANENPYPPLPGVLEAVTAAALELNRYPDFASGALVEELAGYYDVPVEHVALGTGSVGVAQQLLQAAAGPGDEVVYAWRSFEAYPILTQIAGATSVRIPLRGGKHDLAAMADAITERTRLIFVCTPNNPTGSVVGGAEFERFLDRVPKDVLVVLDEAYREFNRDPAVPDGLALYPERPNLCVLRTFSKAYGLAGLRVGYAIAQTPVASALRACALPFGVNLVAQSAGIASLRARDALQQRVEALVAERDRVLRALRSRGVEVEDTEANFYWLPLGTHSAGFAAACEESGVTVRPFDGEGVRVTIGEPEANDVAVAVAARFGGSIDGHRLRDRHRPNTAGPMRQ
jgi:histidinol-phosphate aminotransferase